MNENFQIYYNEKGWGGISHQQREIVKCSGNKGIIGLEEVNGNCITFQSTKHEGKHHSVHISYKAEGWEMVDDIHELDDGFYEIERSWTNILNKDIEVILNLDIRTNFLPNFYFIPCVNYNGNRWGKGKEPKGLTCNNKPWVFAYNRSSLPSATFSENHKYSVGLFASLEQESKKSACSLLECCDGFIHRILWPEREGPYTYSGRDKYSKAKEDTILLKASQTFRAKVYLSVNHVNQINYGWTRTYDQAWSVF